MKGGENEPDEHNPMLGWRGIRRDLQQTDQFRLQVEAFKRLWAEGYSNMGLMFPLVGHPREFIAARALLAGLLSTSKSANALAARRLNVHERIDRATFLQSDSDDIPL